MFRMIAFQWAVGEYYMICLVSSCVCSLLIHRIRDAHSPLALEQYVYSRAKRRGRILPSARTTPPISGRRNRSFSSGLGSRVEEDRRNAICRLAVGDDATACVDLERSTPP